MSITRYTADQVETSVHGNLVAYEDYMYEVAARQEAFRARVELQQRYHEALERIESLRQEADAWESRYKEAVRAVGSLTRDVEELEERLRSK